MNHTNYLRRLAEASEVKFAVIALFAVSVLLNLVLMVVIMALPKTERTHWLPPEVNKGFWVQGDKLSQQYLEQMSWYAIQLMMNVTPDSVKYQGKMLLQIADPKIHETLKKQIYLNAAIIQRDGVSTYFAPRSSYSDFAQYPNRIAYSGNLITLLGDKQTKKVNKTFLLEFGSIAGKTMLVQFKETNHADPLGIKQEFKEGQAVKESATSTVNNTSAGFEPDAMELNQMLQSGQGIGAPKDSTVSESSGLEDTPSTNEENIQ